MALGLRKCCDVWPISIEELQEKTGNMAEWLYYSCRSIDERPVTTMHMRKSLGQEETFATDILLIEELEAHLAVLCTDVAGNLQKLNLKGRTITLKVKYADFTQIARRKTIVNETDSERILLEISSALLAATEAGQRKIRLLGVSVSNFAA